MYPYMFLYEMSETNFNPIYVNTDSDFERVEWRVENRSGENVLVWTDDGSANGDAADTWSSYTPLFNGLGGPIGVRRTVSATAVDADGNRSTREIEIVVWGARDRIWITEMSAPSDVTALETFTCRVETSGGYDRIEWYVDGAYEGTTFPRSSFWRSSFTHAFPAEAGAPGGVGEERTIKAVAHGIGSTDANPVTDEEEFVIRVHRENGRICRDVNAYVQHVFIENEDDGKLKKMTVGWGVTLRYYNDLPDNATTMYAFSKIHRLRKSADGIWMDPNASKYPIIGGFHAPNGSEGGEDYIVQLKVGFDESNTDLFTYTVDETLKRGQRYYGFTKAALEWLTDWNEDDEVEGWMGDSVELLQTETRRFDDWHAGWHP